MTIRVHNSIQKPLGATVVLAYLRRVLEEVGETQIYSSLIPLPITAEACHVNQQLPGLLTELQVSQEPQSALEQWPSTWGTRTSGGM
jgi:hypothetical protein